ncbi:hypothetical protein J4434_06350 [Candidatus Woesearchaeota archaeon]|nr:hypothetical protein [Candidatus Woesearchaeota archaeon]
MVDFNWREWLRQAKYFLTDVWRFLASLFMQLVQAIMEFDYVRAKHNFRTNLDVFFNSKSIYFVLLFLPIILTLIIAISVNAGGKVDYNIGYYSPSENTAVDKFMTVISKPDFNTKKFWSQESCLDSTKTGDTSMCLYFSDNFFKSDNITEKLTLNIDKDKLDQYTKYLTKINSSLVSVVKANSLTDQITLSTADTQNNRNGILISNVLLFFIMFVSLIFASITLYHRRLTVNEFYINPKRYKDLMKDIFLSTFTLSLGVSLVLFFVTSVVLNFSFFGELHKILLILILSIALFTLIGMMIGLLTKSEDVNLFASISTASIMIFFSELVLPTFVSYKSVVSYFFNINPFYITTKLFKQIVLLDKAIGAQVFEILILIILLLILMIFFVVINSLLVSSDNSLKVLLKNKEEEEIVHVGEPEDDSKAPRLSTHEMSIDQFRKLEELRRLKKLRPDVTPTYKETVKIKFEKKQKDDKVEKVNTNVSKKDVKAKEQKVEKKEDKGKKTSERKEKKARSEEESLIASIELENEILELKGQGLSDKQIKEKLEEKYDEDDIETVLGNM